MIKRKTLSNLLFYLVVLAICAVLLFTFVIMLSVAFKGSKEAIAFPPTIIPRDFTFQHFLDVVNANIFPYTSYFQNSLYISLLVCCVVVFLGILGGYALARLNFPGKGFASETFFLVYMFSGILLIVPLFRMLSAVGLRNTREAVVICMIVQTLPTSIYMIRSYFETIPAELEEAGIIDGLGRFGLIFRIMVPLSLSGLVSVFVYAFMISWNDVLFASIFLDSSEKFTIPIGLNSLFNTPDYIWGRMMAASILTSLPIVIMYAFSQRLIKGGAIEGGVKG
jgi:multiple sugar transport system permease protein